LAPVTLDQADLPEYALPTTLHILAANRSSPVFTFLVATLAANRREAGFPIVPAASPPGWNPEIARQPMQNRRQAPHDVALRGAVQPTRKVLRWRPIRAAFARVKMQEERCYAASEACFETKTSQ